MADRAFDIRRLPGAATLAVACFVILYVPMVIPVAYSVNEGRVISQRAGVSLHWYGKALKNEAFLAAARTSLILATLAALIATVTATLAALATTRTRGFKGEGTIHIVLNQPIMVPEIVLAIALLIIIAQVKQFTGYTGLGYLVIAHSAFCIPFAYMPIRARLEGMDLTLEIAADDLCAFRKVTLPLLAPAILAGFMLAFVISLDDVVMSDFLRSPGQDTLSTYLLGELKRNLTSETYAISSLLLLISVLIVAGSSLLTRKKTGHKGPPM